MIDLARIDRRDYLNAAVASVGLGLAAVMLAPSTDPVAYTMFVIGHTVLAAAIVLFHAAHERGLP
jgi:hypothetical protein